MADAGTAPNNKRCHNCRRQRLRCDRSYPHCNKCILAGKECLGYGQLFRWTGAIASRGKLAGKTSMAASDPAAEHVSQQQSDAGPSSSSAYPSPAGTPTPTSAAAQAQDRKGNKGGRQMQITTTKKAWKLAGGSSSSSSIISGNAGGAVVHAAPSTPWVLADPLVQDLSHPYRYYLSYFTERVCKDLVTHDIPEINPYGNLIHLSRDNPLVQHIVVAASAAHRSNTIQFQLNDVRGGQLVRHPSTEDSRRALRDSLMAKQQALRLMREAVQNIDSVGVDVVLAASLFFINVELIESGKHGWKAHLEAAGRVMSMMGPAEGAIRDLRDYMLSDCLIYFVMASAFTSSTSTAQNYFESSQIPRIIERAAANSYICSPPEIPEIIYAAAQLSNVKTADEEAVKEVARAGLELLGRVEAVDVATWASSSLTGPYLKDKPLLASRINAGTAHCLTASLYIVQAVQPVRAIVGQGMADDLSEALYRQLCLIPYEDPNFKAITWPIFIYGGGTKDPERRAWVMARLAEQVRLAPWGFLYTAMETLQIIWNLEAPKDDDGKRSWIDTLKDPTLNFLMV